MSRKQRTPEEIEAEMNEQEQEETEEVEEDEEEEETDEEEESDEEEEESSAEDASDTLIENYGAFLCMGYSPAQIDKHLPKLLADVAAMRKAQVMAMLANIGQPLVTLAEQVYDEHLVPALQEAMKDIRAELGADHVKVRALVFQLSEKLLYYVLRRNADLVDPPWPKPENG